MTAREDVVVPGISLEVRRGRVEALVLDLVGPWQGLALVEERLPGWVRPSNWYLTGSLIPSETRPEKRADTDEDDEMESAVPLTAGLAEESNEGAESRDEGLPPVAGSQLLVAREARALTVTVRRGEYAARSSA